MKLTVVGSSGGYPSAERVCSCYLLEVGGKKIVIDMGTGSLTKLFGIIDASEIDAIVISHFHYDHFSDLLAFQYVFGMRRGANINMKPIPLYCPDQPDAYTSIFSKNKDFHCKFVHDGDRMNICGAEFLFKDTSHPIKTVGMRITYEGKVFAYTSDCSRSTKSFGDLLSNADFAILDCGELEAFNKPAMLHLTPSGCFSVSKNQNIKKCLLSHIIPHYSMQTYESEAIEAGFNDYIIAKDGQTFEI